MNKLNNIDMEDPLQLESGELACPQCKTPLVEGTVPYYLKGTKLGYFDGLKCLMCHYGLLSEKGYEDSGKV